MGIERQNTTLSSLSWLTVVAPAWGQCHTDSNGQVFDGTDGV